jgi:hypothetical protein|tara:strand:+ start:1157 stop:1942 length:786 start_codon:yes stop_codon:yes gene_type:complete
METLTYLVGTVVLLYIFLIWLKKKKRNSQIESIKALLTLLNIMMSVDKSVTDEETQKVFYSLYNLIKDSGPDGPFSEYWTHEEGVDFVDPETITSMVIASNDYVGEMEFKHGDTEIDSRVFAEFDSLTNLIVKDHRDYAFRSLVALCGADLDWHANEVKALDYLSTKLKIKNKDIIVDEERTRVEQVLRDIEANKVKIALWDEKIKKVTVPGWKKETGDFMGHLYDKDIDVVLSTPDKQLAKDIPGITEAKAKVIKKLLSE